MDPLFGMDDVAIKNEFLHLFTHATVVESMLVSLTHMQVDVCYMRGKRNSRNPITKFRKNITSFPQHVNELEQLENYLNNVQINDIVNVVLPKHASTELFRARVRGIDKATYDCAVMIGDVEVRRGSPGTPLCRPDAISNRNRARPSSIDLGVKLFHLFSK